METAHSFWTTEVSNFRKTASNFHYELLSLETSTSLEEEFTEGNRSSGNVFLFGVSIFPGNLVLESYPKVKQKKKYIYIFLYIYVEVGTFRTVKRYHNYLDLGYILCIWG